VDTRTKIVEPAEFSRLVSQWRTGGVGVTIAAGPFDPLLAGHATAAEKARPDGGRLAVIVTQPAGPILEPRARAELAAGLAAVDLVTLTAPGLPKADLDWEQDHAAASVRFVAHVLDRMS
jgi:bifunctional ADP-heptose synthase (sugar kinase/adenylyltransferase)